MLLITERLYTKLTVLNDEKINHVRILYITTEQIIQWTLCLLLSTLNTICLS